MLCQQTLLGISMKSLELTFLFSLVVTGASGEETESVSVIVGDSFTLHTDVTQLDGVIVWSFGEDVIARISSESNENKIFVNDNETFRVKPDSQTGDLQIRKIRTTDMGLYKLEINNSSGISSKTFNVSCLINVTSDGEKLVPVLDRDSVILPSGLTEIQRNDQITWKFEGTLIGQLRNQTAEIFADILDGRFKDRLQMYQQNGSLIVTNVRPNTSGLYEVDITKSGTNYTTHKTFRVTILDGGDRLLVMEGTSVTLETGVSKIHKDDVIIWRCEHGDSIIAKISPVNFTTLDGADGRFRGKLKLDYKTGSLTIRNIRRKHAGLYHLDITGKQRTIFKRINLSVCPQDWSPWVILAVLLLVVAVAILLICCQNWFSRQTKIASRTHPENESQEVETEQEFMLTHDITTTKGVHAYLSQTLSGNLEHMISPALTGTVVQCSATRRHTLKKVI